MGSPTVLAFLVGLAVASSYGFQQGTEYVYQVNGRTLTGFQKFSDRYSGILYKSKLSIRPASEDELIAQISDAQYSPFNAELPGGWQSDLPESKLQYRPFPSTQKPFKIILKDGVFQDLIVDSEMSNVEANVIKSIVSNIQLDTQARNKIDSRMNQLPQGDSRSAVFKTMEESVTGKYETLYEINQLPAKKIQYQPWLAPYASANDEGKLIEVVKHKNYSNAQNLVEYHYGLEGFHRDEPSTNSMGDFFLRSAVSRAIITGDLRRYTIQSSVTVNKVVLSPTLTSQDKGAVVSYLNLTLSNMRPDDSQPEGPSNQKSLGTLIYRYSDPFSSNTAARLPLRSATGNAISNENESEREDVSFSSYMRQKRSASLSENENERQSSSGWESASTSSSEETSQESWNQQQIPMSKQPRIPLLPYFVGYDGQSVRFAEGMNIPERVQSLARAIAQDLQKPETLPKQQTLSKYVMLIKAIRLMDVNEVQQVAKDLYTEKQSGSEYETWSAYKDAVADSGTGPALLAVMNWILTGRVSGSDAASLIYATAHSANAPSDDYMRNFYKFVFRDEVQSQSTLNTTAIIAYSELVDKVYVNKESSHNEYPVHAFGSFRSQAGKDFVQQDYIPRLGNLLNEAVEKADSNRIHVYIKAMAQIGHPEILSYFEPYLEGEKPMSQYQRFLIVSNLDRLGEAYPKTARSVLYKIYQNAGEVPEVRIAAVYQLMKTSPPASMLQRMAEYTNMEENQQVNAAVKSSIVSASNLKMPQYATLRSNARAALPLLTPKEYGYDYSYNGVFSYDENSKDAFQTLQTSSSPIPEDIRFSHHHAHGQFKQNAFGVRHSISSLRSLMRLLNNKKDVPSDILTLYQNLGLQTDAPEETEGNFEIKLGSLHRFYSYNNRTIKQLPQILEQLLKQVGKGGSFESIKFFNADEHIISFPTETGLPFVYTVNRPSVARIRVKDAEVNIPSNMKQWYQQGISGQAKVELLLSTKVEGQIGFITPFDHQQYSSGYERSVQVYLPKNVKGSVNPSEQKLKAEIQQQQPAKNTRVIQYTSAPYVTAYDILDFQPVITRPNTKVIYTTPNNPQQTTVGKEQVFRIHYNGDIASKNFKKLYEQVRTRGIVHTIMSVFNDQNARYAAVAVEYAGDVSQSSKLYINAGHLKWAEYTDNSANAQHEIPNVSADLQPLAIAKKMSQGINSAVSSVYYAQIKFDNDNANQYAAVMARTSSRVDEQSRTWFKLAKYSNSRDNAPAYISALANSYAPKRSELDALYNLKHDLSGNSSIQIEVNDGKNPITKAQINIDMITSEERRQQLQQSYSYKQCQAEHQQGNNQLPACANLTAEAAKYDKYRGVVQYENLSPALYNASLQLYSAFNSFYYMNAEENYVQTQNQDQYENSNRIEFNVDYNAPQAKINLSLTSPTYRAAYKNINVATASKAVQLQDQIFLQGNNEKRSCSYEKNAMNTFDNRTFPLQDNDRHVLMLFYAAPVDSAGQWKGQNDYYKIEVKSDSNENKEVKISYVLKDTVSNMKLNPSSLPSSANSGKAKVTIDGNEEQISSNKVNYFHNGFLQIYALPSGEVKVKVGHAFNVLYDGQRVKATQVNPKFANALRGVCGNYNGEPSDDFVVPNNCVVKDSEVFVDSYTLLYPPQDQKREYDNCADPNAMYYANVISDMDAGRSRPWQKSGGSSRSACSVQTQYHEQAGEICFTLQRQPTCRSGCRASNYISKKVPVHCMKSGTKVAEMWKAQILKGASPDFSLKTATKSVEMRLPQGCSHQ